MEIDENCNENECVIVNTHKILGTEFPKYNGQLPTINTPIILEVGVSFPSPKIADHYIEQYALQQHFSVFKAKLEVYSDNTFRKRVFKCDMGGRYEQKLSNASSSKRKGSKKIGCEWQINMTKPKKSSLVTITTFKNIHRHDLSIETLKFAPAYRSFSSDITEEIEFYLINGRCDASTIRNLLQPKYPERVFLTQDLGNAIQKIKRDHHLQLGDASSLLTKLLQLQSENSSWFVKPWIDDTSDRLIGLFWMSPQQRERWLHFNDIIIHDNTARTNKYNYPLSLFIIIDNFNKSRLAAQAFLADERQESYVWLLQVCLEATSIQPKTFVTDADPAMLAASSIVFNQSHHMLCLYHLYQNLSKNLRPCLGIQYQNFLIDFKHIQKSLTEDVFNKRSLGLIDKYPEGKKYISDRLLDKKNMWAKCFTSCRFTAGTQSTQRVESENALIQKAVHSSFTLFQVQEAIEQRLETENINNRYSIWKASNMVYPQPFIVSNFFQEIDNVIKKYVTKPIHDIHYKQMCESVCYKAYQVDSNEISTFNDEIFEPLVIESQEFEMPLQADDDREMYLRSLIERVDQNDILEIWKVTRYNYPKCYQHVILLRNGEHLCTCFMIITHGIICRHFFKVYMESDRASFHILLIPNRWYQDQFIDCLDLSNEASVNVNKSGSNQNNIQRFERQYTCNDNLQVNEDQKKIQSQLKYGTLMGEAKKAIQYAIQDEDDELLYFIKNYNIQKKQSYESARLENQIITTSEGNHIDIQNIQDPIYHQPKGRIPFKRLKSVIENHSKTSQKPLKELTNNESQKRRCGMCGNHGHYRNTCHLNTT